jgi:hypothetical protein
MAKSYDAIHLRERLATCFPPISSCHTPNEHQYQREDTGRVAKSVTTKLGFANKGYLTPWYVKLAIEHIRVHRDRCTNEEEWESLFVEAREAGNNSRDTSAEIGTTAHDAVDRYLQDWIRLGRRPRGEGWGAEHDSDRTSPFRRASVYLGDNPRGSEVAACRSFDLFLEENEIVPLASEIKVWYEECPRHKSKTCPDTGSCVDDTFAGSVDAAFLLLSVRKGREGEKGVLDIEGRPHDEHDYIPQESGTWWCSTCGRECDPSLILGDWKTSNAIAGKDEYALQGTAYTVAIEKAAEITFDDIWVIRLDKARAEYEIRKVEDRKAAWEEFITISRAYDRKQLRRLGDSDRFNSLLVPLKEKVITRI